MPGHFLQYNRIGLLATSTKTATLQQQYRGGILRTIEATQAIFGKWKTYILFFPRIDVGIKSATSKMHNRQANNIPKILHCPNWITKEHFKRVPKIFYLQSLQPRYYLFGLHAISSGKRWPCWYLYHCNGGCRIHSTIFVIIMKSWWHCCIYCCGMAAASGPEKTPFFV